MQCRKNNFLNKCWENWISTYKEMFIIHYTQKPNQNALDLNAKPETVKLLEENIKGRLKGSVFAMMFWM